MNPSHRFEPVPASTAGCITAVVMAILVAALAACGGSSGDSGNSDSEYLRVIDAGKTYGIEDVKSIGYKVAKTYDVNGLVDAVAAYYGFWQPPADSEPADYEVRIFPSHAVARDSGTAQAEEATGDNAVLDRADSSWPTGLSERRWVIGGSSTGGSVARYPDYVILGNLIILCQGRNAEHSQERCNAITTTLR